MAVIIWIAVIFFLSNEPVVESIARSDIFLYIAQSTEIPVFEGVTEAIVRKSAHFGAYLVLGALIFNVVRDYARSIRRAMLVSILFASLYACTDEIHQLFVPGRSGEFGDVLIDTLGAAVGVGIFTVIVHIIRARRASKQSGSGVSP